MNISLNCPCNQLGYGIASVNILKALIELNHKVSLFPISINFTKEEVGKFSKYIEEGIKNSETFDSNAPSIRIWHQHSLSPHFGYPRIGFPFFELDTFTPLEKHHLSSQEALFVSSKWAKKIIEQNDITTPTFVVPLGVDKDIFSNGNTIHNDDKNTTKFINIGKWEIRKGADIIVEAFNKAFNVKDNIHLYMVPDNPFLKPEQTKEWEDYYLNSPLGKVGKISIIHRHELPTHLSLAHLIRKCDCGVFPARAEGWNLELLECMASGLEVITTDYSGHTEFCNNKNAKLIGKASEFKLESAYDGIWFHNQGNWLDFEPKHMEEFINYLRITHIEKQQRGNICNEEGIKTSWEYTWENTAKTIVRHLQTI